MNDSLPIGSQGRQIVSQTDFFSLNPDSREQVMVQIMLQNQELIKKLEARGDKLESHVKNISDQLEKEKESNEKAHSTINQLCQEKNLEDYKKISEKINTCCPNKDNVWKHRVLSAILKINIATQPDEIEKAIQSNKDVRCQLRIFLKAYNPSNLIYIYPTKDIITSKIRKILIKLAKLILRENPLISWELLKSKLEKAGITLDTNSSEYLIISKSAEYLFDNIDILFDDLYQQAGKPPEPEPNSEDYFVIEDEWGGVSYYRKDYWTNTWSD